MIGALAEVPRANRRLYRAFLLREELRHGFSNGGLEGLTSKIRLISHRSFGLHSADALIALSPLLHGIIIELPRSTSPTNRQERLVVEPNPHTVPSDGLVIPHHEDDLLTQDAVAPYDRFAPAQNVSLLSGPAGTRPTAAVNWCLGLDSPFHNATTAPARNCPQVAAMASADASIGTR